MLATVAALTAHTARRLTELGALLGLLAGIALALAGLPAMRRGGAIVAGILFIVGFALIIYALHYGKAGV
jgi:multisubunit Na+/H+ antiporter MnhB subunit